MVCNEGVSLDGPNSLLSFPNLSSGHIFDFTVLETAFVSSQSSPVLCHDPVNPHSCIKCWTCLHRQSVIVAETYFLGENEVQISHPTWVVEYFFEFWYNSNNWLDLLCQWFSPLKRFFFPLKGYRLHFPDISFLPVLCHYCMRLTK